jgi:hypothetical protein
MADSTIQRKYVQNQKDVILEDIILTPFGSGSFSIRSLVVSFGIYENIYKNFIEGDIELIDGIDLIDSIPIVGKELIEFKFRTPTSQDVRSVKMIVNSIKDRVNSNDNKANVIALSLISLSSYQNSINKVSESMSGTCTDLISSICDQYLENKEIIADATSDTQFKFAFPFLSPAEKISCVTKRAIPKTSKNPNANSGYIFFETLQDFKFRSLNLLFQQTPKFLFTDSKIVRATNDIVPDKKIESITSRLRFIKNSDRRKQTLSGSLNSKNYFHDLLTKEWGMEDYSYLEDSDSFTDFKPKTLEYLSSESIPDKDRKKVVAENDPLTKTPSQINTFARHSKIYGDEFQKNEMNFELSRHIISNLTMSRDTVVETEVNGMSNLFAGDCVYLRAHSNVAGQANSFDDEKSGVYLVSQIQHRVTLGKGTIADTYKCGVQFIKNYRVNEIPEKGNVPVPKG